MNVVLWIAQAVLAAIFLMSGSAKAVMTKENMIKTGQTGVTPLPLWAIRVVAGLELLGAVGLVIPWAVGIAPVLTPLAAVGLGLVMIGAAISHASLKEFPQALILNPTIFLVCVFVAAGRFLSL